MRKNKSSQEKLQDLKSKVQLENPQTSSLMGLLQFGSQKMLSKAIKAEISEHLGNITRQGKELSAMFPTQVQLLFQNPEVLFTRVTAQQKTLIVQALRNTGEIVAAIIFNAPGNLIFGTKPFELIYWFAIIPFLLFMILMEELRKWLLNKIKN